MEADELKERIAAFPIWQYEFEFDNGVKTPVGDRKKITRNKQRRSYFFEALLHLTGGSLDGRRVLDLGCNAGFWSLQAIEAGAEFVLGIDGKDSYIDQANLVFDAKGIDSARYRFENGNIFEHEFNERFDVVLCLGLLSVVAKPVELFELMASLDPELIVIDTGLSRLRPACFELSQLGEPQNAVDHTMVLVPTRRAVAELADQFGFSTIALAYNTAADPTGMEDYASHRRLAFICSRTASLGVLAADEPSSHSQWMATLTSITTRVSSRLGR